MNNTKLMKLVPININEKNTNNILSRDYLKKVLLTIFKIASYKGYNEKLNILHDNSYIPDTNVVELLYEVFEGSNNLDERFISLLAKADVQPDVIKNEKAKDQLKDQTKSIKLESKPIQNITKENPQGYKN